MSSLGICVCVIDNLIKQGELSLVEEQRNKTGDCYYLFELEDGAVCPTTKSALSIGSILVIM